MGGLQRYAVALPFRRFLRRALPVCYTKEMISRLRTTCQAMRRWQRHCVRVYFTTVPSTDSRYFSKDYRYQYANPALQDCSLELACLPCAFAGTSFLKNIDGRVQSWSASLQGLPCFCLTSRPSCSSFDASIPSRWRESCDIHVSRKLTLAKTHVGLS